MKYITTIVILLLFIGGAWYYLSQPKAVDNSAALNNTPTEEVIPPITTEAVEQATTTEANNSTSTASTTAVREFKINGFMFGYTPNEMRVTQGDTVKVVFTSTDGFHDWVVDEFNARTKQIQTGETSEVTFVADKAGTFEYYCSVGQHRAKGMVGTLIVDAK
jgi:nitrite reductase (NO-forming)